MNLSKKLISNFIISILISIFIISIISNFMINKRFDKYLIEEQADRFNEIYLDVNRLFLEKGQELRDQDIEAYSEREGIYLEVRGKDNRPVCHSQHMTPGGMMKHRGRHHHGMMGASRRPSNYSEKTFPLLDKNNENIGSLIIGYEDTSHLTESALLFKGTLSKSFLISGIIAIILGFLLSLSLAQGLSRPIVAITNTANEIREGRLEARSRLDSDVKEISHLSNSINYLAQSLEDQEDLRRRYALDIAHELRTPLTTLKSHLEAMVDGVWETSPDHFNTLINEIDGLAKLVDDLKNTFTEMEGQLNINKTHFNLSQELEDIVSEFQPFFQSQSYSLAWDLEEDIEISMDRYRLKQIISNLLSNASKYLPQDGRVLVSLEREGGRARISIEDNGSGISQEDLPFIFERFYRADVSRNRKTGGTGLGLSIVKSLVEAHNGEIYVESKKNQGTRFTILLPL